MLQRRQAAGMVLLEAFAEAGGILKSAQSGCFLHIVPSGQQMLCLGQADAENILLQGIVGVFVEHIGEVAAAQTEPIGDALDGDRLLVVQLQMMDRLVFCGLISLMRQMRSMALLFNASHPNA